MGVAQTEDRRLRVLELWRLLELLSTQQAAVEARQILKPESWALPILR